MIEVGVREQDGTDIPHRTPDAGQQRGQLAVMSGQASVHQGQILAFFQDVEVDHAVTQAERPAIRRIWAIPDPAEKVRAYAGFAADLNQRLGALAAVLAEADPEVAQVRAATEDERLHGLRAFTGHLAAGGWLAGEDMERAAEECWVLTSLAVYVQLTVARQWSAGAYRDWLARMLAATLLARRAEDRPAGLCE